EELPKGARPDLSVDGTIELERLDNVVFVGRPAFGQENNTVGMFKLVPGSSEAVRAPVKLGKSSVNTIEILSGLNPGDQVILSDTPSNGSYALKGGEVANLSFADRARIRNREIGFIFQSFNLIGDLTVFENVELPLTYRGMSAGDRKTLVTQALDRVGMAHRA